MATRHTNIARWLAKLEQRIEDACYALEDKYGNGADRADEVRDAWESWADSWRAIDRRDAEWDMLER